MRILFMPMAGALGIGGMTRCLAVATDAALWGHEIGFFCSPKVFPLLQNIDAAIFEAPIPPPPENIAAPDHNLSDGIRIRRMDDLSYIETTVEAELAAFLSFRPDIIFTEFQPTAAISAAIASLPLVSTASWATHPDFSSPSYEESQNIIGVAKNFNIVLEKYNLDSIQNIAELTNFRSALNVAPTIPELDPHVAKFPNLHYVGSLLYPGIELGAIPSELLQNEQYQLIYVYRATGALEPEKYIPELTEAFSSLSFNIAVVLRADSYLGKKLPLRIGNIFLYRLLPGLTIIRRSSVVITRGGQNTLMSCMLAGTPIVGFTDDHAEGNFNTDGVVRLGAGLKCDDNEFHAVKLREMIDRVISDTSYRERAWAIGDKIRTYGGSHATLQLMSKLM